jgi:hypothetical protein
MVSKDLPPVVPDTGTRFHFNSQPDEVSEPESISEPESVPEPATLAGLGFVAVGFGVSRRRKARVR